MLAREEGRQLSTDVDVALRVPARSYLSDPAPTPFCFLRPFAPFAVPSPAAGLFFSRLMCRPFSSRAAPLVALLVFVFAIAPRLAATPDEIRDALATFHAEGSRDWSFTQTTRTSKTSLVERYDASKPEFRRWSLVEKDDRPATVAEKKEYRERLTRRSRGDTAPNVKDQIDPASAEIVSDDGDYVAYRFRLKPSADDDKTAEHMAATFTLHRPTKTITRVELASIAPFSPMMVVKINEARTVMIYSLPEGDRPTLLQEVTMRVRGRSFGFRSLDDDMTITYSDHEKGTPERGNAKAAD